jgi:hypothetical protein
LEHSNSNNQHESLKVGLDYFLYSCFEFETTCRALPHKILGDTRWPYSLEISEGIPTDHVAEREFETLLEELTDWYNEKFPMLPQNIQLDLALLPEVVPAVVMIATDVSLVARAKNLESQLIYDKTLESNGPIWDKLDHLMKTKFPSFAKFILRYLQWVFGVERIIEVDFASRPPVGRFIRDIRRQQSSLNRSAAAAPSSEGQKSERGAPKTGSRPSSRGSSYSERRGGGKSSYDRGDRHSGGRSDDSSRNRFKKEKDPQLEAEAAQSVKDAIEKLNADANLTEVRLDPANSYYRRLQHKQIKEFGFTSSSTGEGADRAVVVMRDDGSSGAGGEGEND